jgi:membrane AbrB-like protein
MTPDADVLLFSCASFVGGAFGKFTKLPGGPLLGATVAVAAIGISLNLSHTPPPFLILLIQLLTGCMLGQSISRRFWRNILQIWRPCLTVILLYTLLAAPFAAVLTLAFGFDALTALLAATPARMQDMIVLAGSVDSDAVTVMLMQLARQFAIIGITPFLLMQYAGGKKTAAQTDRHHRGPRPPAFCRTDAEQYALLLAPGVAGAVTGNATGHILGALLGAFCGVALSRVIWPQAGEIPFPKSFAFIIQCLAGILLGSRVTPEIGGLVLTRLTPLAAACFYVIIAGMMAAAILRRRYGWHGGMSWMAAAPGRVSDMLAMSQDIDLSDGERLALASVHALRQVYFTLLISAAMVFF